MTIEDRVTTIAKYTRDDIIQILKERLNDQGYTMLEVPTFNILANGFLQSKINPYLILQDVEIRVQKTDKGEV